MKKYRALLLFVLAVIIGAILLFSPPLRPLFLAQLRGDGFYRGWAYGPIPRLENDFDAQKLNIENATDTRVLAVHAFKQPNAIGALDALIEKQPQEAGLLAWRLSLSLNKMQLDRVGGELSDAKLTQHQAAKIASPERKNTKPNFTSSELEKCLVLARRGQKLEPDNAFFDWMLTYFYMASWRDAQAFRALQNGSHKAHFNPHKSDLNQAFRAAQSHYYGAPQAPEAWLFLRFSDIEIDDLPSYSKQREMARIIAWQGMKMQRRGEHQKALQLFTDMARMHLTAAREADSYIEEMVYYAMAAISLGRAGQRDESWKKIPYGDTALHEKRAALTAKQVQTYANAHGKAALGREIAALIGEEGQRRDKLQRAFKAQMAFNGLDKAPLVWSISLYWAASLLLLLLLLLVFWWLLIGGVLRLASVPQMLPEKNDIARGVWAATFATALLWTIAFALGAGWGLLLLDFLNQSPFRIAGSFICLIIGFLWPIPLSSWIIKRRARRRENLARGIVLRGVKERAKAVWNRFSLVALLSISSLYMLASAMAFWWLCAMAAQDNITWSNLFGTDATFFSLPNWLNQSINIFPLWPQLFFAVALALLWLRELFAPDKSRAAYQLRTWHAVLKNLIVVASVSYVLLLVVLVPWRARAEVAVNQYIQRGEVASMLLNFKS